MKWDQETTFVHPPAKDIPVWIAAACVALVAARLFARLRRRWRPRRFENLTANLTANGWIWADQAAPGGQTIVGSLSK
jgi:hypothetical protein